MVAPSQTTFLSFTLPLSFAGTAHRRTASHSRLRVRARLLFFPSLECRCVAARLVIMLNSSCCSRQHRRRPTATSAHKCIHQYRVHRRHENAVLPRRTPHGWIRERIVPAISMCVSPNSVEGAMASPRSLHRQFRGWRARQHTVSRSMHAPQRAQGKNKRRHRQAINRVHGRRDARVCKIKKKIQNKRKTKKPKERAKPQNERRRKGEERAHTRTPSCKDACRGSGKVESALKGYQQ